MQNIKHKLENLPKEQKTFIGGIVIGSLAGMICSTLIASTWVLNLIY